MIWKRKYGKVIILGTIFLVSVLAFWFGLKTILRTEFPLLPVDSASMYPALNYGDLIIVQGVVNACDIEPGDIIIFQEWTLYNGDLIVLRAVEKTVRDGSCYFRTRGEANPSNDTWEVRESDIVGKCIGRVPWLGYVPLFMRERVFPFLSTPAGFLIVILVILSVMLLYYIPLRKKRAEA
ncbi:MAG: signal peptidase I [Candidatus Bathyarchaeia archaeon]